MMPRKELLLWDARILALSLFVEVGNITAEAAEDDVMQFHDDGSCMEDTDLQDLRENIPYTV